MRALAAAVALALLAAPRAQAGSRQARRTDLGDTGNAAVAAAFEGYQAQNRSGACRAGGGGRKVLITGFGPFGSASNNLSGTVAASMAEETLFPAETVTSRPPLPLTGPPRKGRLSASDSGGRAVNRRLRIDGQDYDVCFLLLDVKWDLAGAIIIFETSHFAPDLVLMTGEGIEPYFEGSAYNRTSAAPGADSDGRPLGPEPPGKPSFDERVAAARADTSSDRNVPLSHWIVPDAPVGDQLALSWDTSQGLAATAPFIHALGFEAKAGDDPKNDYVCNNVAYVVQRWLQGLPVELAGGRIRFPASRPPARARAGFFHYPPALAGVTDLKGLQAAVAAWARVVTLIVSSQLAPR